MWSPQQASNRAALGCDRARVSHEAPTGQPRPRRPPMTLSSVHTQQAPSRGTHAVLVGVDAEVYLCNPVERGTERTAGTQALSAGAGPLGGRRLVKDAVSHDAPRGARLGALGREGGVTPHGDLRAPAPHSAPHGTAVTRSRCVSRHSSLGLTPPAALCLLCTSDHLPSRGRRGLEDHTQPLASSLLPF